MKAKYDSFEEVKVKMVMKLKKLSRPAAVEEIARMDAAKRKASEEEASRVKAEKARTGEELRGRRGLTPNISRSGSDDLLSAEEFFGGL